MQARHEIITRMRKHIPGIAWRAEGGQRLPYAICITAYGRRASRSPPAIVQAACRLAASQYGSAGGSMGCSKWGWMMFPHSSSAPILTMSWSSRPAALSRCPASPRRSCGGACGRHRRGRCASFPCSWCYLKYVTERASSAVRQTQSPPKSTQPNNRQLKQPTPRADLVLLRRARTRDRSATKTTRMS